VNRSRHHWLWQFAVSREWLWCRHSHVQRDRCVSPIGVGKRLENKRWR